MPALPHNTALLVIDVPAATADRPPGPGRNNPDMEANIARLESAWRASGRPAIRVAHQARWPGAPIHYSALVGTDLEGQLRRRGVATLVLTGLATDRCVSTTARQAANVGFTTYVVSDATATFDRRGPDGRWHRAATVHAVALAELNGEFATIIDTPAVLAALGVTPCAA
ncbi:MAG TPA: isochorismatase family protein [Gemmatimonadales bacterium]|jgi:nicotinamidase-related amidase|nr:isochorismatase family protein [Gemmatimonadales bacterium]